MDHIRIAEDLSEQILALESKLDKLRLLRDSHAELGQESSDIAPRELVIKPLVPLPTKKRRPGKEGLMDSLSRFFSENANEWATMKQIAAGTDRKVASVRQAIYKTHAGKFERISRKGFGAESTFRLLDKE